MSHDSVNFREGTDLIRIIHLRPTIIKGDQLDHSPAIASRLDPLTPAFLGSGQNTPKELLAHSP